MYVYQQRFKTRLYYAVLTGFGALLFVMGLLLSIPRSKFLLILALTAMFLLLFAHLVGRLFSKKPDFIIDYNRITCCTFMLGTKAIPWSEIRGVSVRKRKQSVRGKWSLVDIFEFSIFFADSGPHLRDSAGKTAAGRASRPGSDSRRLELWYPDMDLEAIRAALRQHGALYRD